MIFWLDVYIKALYICVVLCFGQSVLIPSTGIPLFRNPAAHSVNGYIVVCKFSVKYLAREVRFADFAILSPFKW
jgi:hypothetical protein